MIMVLIYVQIVGNIHLMTTKKILVKSLEVGDESKYTKQSVENYLKRTKAIEDIARYNRSRSMSL